MKNSSGYIWFAGILASFLFVFVFIFFGYKPTTELIRQNQIDRVAERTVIHRLLLDTEIERAIQGAKSISSRSMIRNKIIDYKEGEITLEALQTYTQSKYEDGLRALDKFYGATRIAGTDTISVAGEPVNIQPFSDLKEASASVAIVRDTLIINVISPIKNKTGDIIAYDLVRMKDATALSNLRAEGMALQIVYKLSEPMPVLLTLNDVVVSEERDILTYSIGSSAGSFDYIFQTNKADVLAPFMEVRSYTVYVILILLILLISNGMLLRNYLLQRNRNKLLSLRNEVRDSKQNFEEIFAMSPAGVAITDQNGKIKKVNKVMTELLAVPEEQLKGVDILDVFSLQTINEYEPDSRKFNSYLLEGKEISLLNHEGIEIELLLSLRKLENEQNDSFIVVAVDISELKRSRRLVENALEEKDVLIAEIHHRVKNNLAMICGLLHLQVSNANDPNLKNELMSSLSRVKTIADVHEITYESDQLSKINMKVNTESILKRLQEMYPTDGRIQIDIRMHALQLDLSRALPLSQIINEVVTDRLQFGFSKHAKGNLAVICEREEKKVILTIVQDSDQAIHPLFSRNTLSEQLTFALVQQLDSTPDIQYSEHGLTFSLPVPTKYQPVQ